MIKATHTVVGMAVCTHTKYKLMYVMEYATKVTPKSPYKSMLLDLQDLTLM